MESRSSTSEAGHPRRQAIARLLFRLNRRLWKIPVTRRGLAFACSATLVLAILPSHPKAEINSRFLRLSVEQGLSQSTVQAILQDHAGFMWFGTEEGLNRYDGYTFVVFKHNPHDSRSLPDDVVSALYEDRNRQLWVGTQRGLSLYDRQSGTFSRISRIVDRVTSIVEGADGTLWVGADGGGLFRRDLASGEFTSYQPESDNSSSLASFGVSALLLERNGRLWVGTRETGVDLLDTTSAANTFVHHRRETGDPDSLSADEVWGLAEDPVGNLWVATYGGGLSVRGPTGTGFRHYRHRAGDVHGLPTDLLTCLFVDRAGTLWVGTDGAGILQYDAKSDQFISAMHDPGNASSLSQNVVRSVYEDVQGQVWVGTYLGGVNLLKAPRHAFDYFTHDPADSASLSDPAVACFLEDHEGNVWLGTERGWLNRFDRQTGSFVRYRFPSDRPGGSAVLSLHQDRRNRIWVGTYLGGLARFDPKTGRFEVYKHRPDDPKSLANDEVWAIVEDDEGELWVGTNASVARFDPEHGVVLTQFQTPSPGGLSYAGVRSLLFDRHGNLWVGTFGGLSVLHHGSSEITRYQHDDDDSESITSGAVVALHEDLDGRIWAGTLGGGVSRIDTATGKFTSFKDLPSNVVYGVQEDDSGRLWLSSNHGLSRFDPSSGSIESFDLANGLQSLQFHMGASLKTRGGRMLFGSVDGFYDFDPSTIKPDSFAPPLVLSSLRIFNEPVKLPVLSSVSEITLSHNDKILSIEVAALDYTFPRRNRYAYRMGGLGDEWIELGTKREVTFTNLEAGTYVFQVKASNSDGVWAEASTVRLKVIVEPPFWGTWWFRILAVALVALGLLTAHRLRVRRLTADINERKRAETALRQAEEKYRRLFEEDLSADVISTPDGSVLECNPAFVNLFGFDSSEEAMKANLASFDTGPRTWDTFVQMVRDQKKIEYYETELLRLDGTIISVVSNVVGVFNDSGDLIEIRVYVFDNTEHKRLEKQLLHAQKMEAIGRLAGGLAHDFNNWLTPIIGYSQLLLRELPMEDPKRKEIEEISKAGERASTLASQLLAFSRKQVLQPRVISPNQVVADMRDMLTRLLGEDVELATQLDPNVGRIKADPGQIEQVILNLSLNSRDAMPRGGRITISTANLDVDDSFIRHHPGAESGPWVVLIVNDTGCGMDAETQAHIFEPFFTTKARDKGTGLGLSTVYGIVNQSGGNISVASEVGRGTTFKIYLPRIDESPVAHGLSGSRPVPHGSETIVLVEDEPMVRSFVAIALRDHGYSVMETEDAGEALRLAEEYKGMIHLLLTDVVMPKMSGPELAEHFLTLRPYTRILYMSGYAGDAIMHHGIMESGRPFLQKPFTPEALARKVDEVLHESF